MIYLVSDTHFHHHKLCLSYPDRFEGCRKYQTTDEMDKDIVDVWNSTINSSDDVIFVGDFILDVKCRDFVSEFNKYWNMLNGNKTYIKGNHDSLVKKTGIVMKDRLDLDYNGRMYHIKHYPFIKENMKIGDVYVHGHTHSTVPFADGQNNVCWEAWYKPVSIDELKSAPDISSLNASNLS